MDVKVSNQINNNSLQESGVNTLTSSQICGGFFNKGEKMTDRMSKQEFNRMIRQKEIIRNIHETIQHAESKGFTGAGMARIIEMNLSNDY